MTTDGTMAAAAEMARSRPCEVINSFIGLDWPCGRTAAGYFRRACVHEHIRDGWFCQEHLDLSHLGCCRACAELDGGLAHDCPITLMPLNAGMAS